MKTSWNSFIPKLEQLLRRFTENTDSSADDARLDILYQKIQSDGYLRKKIQDQERFDCQKAEVDFFAVIKPRNNRRIIWRWAAALLLPLGVAVGLFFSSDMNEQQQICENAQESLNPEHVYLLTSTQHRYNLDVDSLPVDIESRIQSNGNEIHYAGTGDEEEEEAEAEIHTLVVPRGGEYSIILSDSTQVWLNSDSRISYPVHFSGNMREVYISGEGYFKVTKQTGKPFIVNTDRGAVTVWGTEFNVEAYEDEDTFVTTLVTGSVSCTLPDGEKVMLRPQEQLSCSKNGKPIVQRVNTIFACGWKDGLFHFRNERMEDITRQLVRWFDIEVQYLDEAAKNLHFSGDLNKFQNVDTFIQMFKGCADLNIWFENNVLYIESI